ncbi:hypothetical protein ACTG2V_22140 [Aeromonas sp. 74A]
MALHYIGGIIKHAKAINAFRNPTTNSYKRLVPGYEAPVMLAYSPQPLCLHLATPVIPTKARRIEVRFRMQLQTVPWPSQPGGVAGLDGVHQTIHPGDAMDKNLYDLPPKTTVSRTALLWTKALATGICRRSASSCACSAMTSSTPLELKQQDVDRVRMTPHPLEFELYTSVSLSRLADSIQLTCRS